MDKLKYVKLEQQDGSYSESIPIVADSEYIEFNNDTLTNRLNKAPYYYNSVADMKADTGLKIGDMAITLGYYEIDDGGEGEYKIISGNYTDDGGSYHKLNNNLYAQLIVHNDVLNVKQFGVKANVQDDMTTKMQAAADYASIKGYEFFVPVGKYNCEDFTLNNIKRINIAGEITLPNANTILAIYESTAVPANYIYINTIWNGTILMKGLNSSDIHIQKASTLKLYADNTDNHKWMCFNKFYLGWLYKLFIEDDGSGMKYINENLFIGGRYVGEVNIGTGNSTYTHENNLFIKPMSESNTWNFGKAKGNQIISARLEGSNSIINFSENSFANYIEQNFADSGRAYFFPTSTVHYGLTINDQSGGANRFCSNKGIESYPIAEFNKINPAPNSIINEEGYVVPNRGASIYETDIIEAPNARSCIDIYTDNPNIYMNLYCYDENKELIIGNNPNFIWDSIQFGWNETEGKYYNTTSQTYKHYWIIMNGNVNNVKYIKFKVFSKSHDDFPFKDMKILLNTYGNLDSMFIQQIQKNILLENN